MIPIVLRVPDSGFSMFRKAFRREGIHRKPTFRADIRRQVLFRLGLLSAAIVLVGGQEASAQTNTSPVTPSNAQQSACSSEAYRQFDFWLGTWDVTDPSGKHVGVNRITSAENGCLILERWEGASGSTGQSMNFYDPIEDTWRQVWVSSGAVIDYTGGLSVDGDMVLTGEIHYHNGRSASFTGTWSLLADGRIKQHFQQLNSDTGEWRDWFTGYYSRVSLSAE
ncbi:MAG: hypothetical protein AAFR21_00245 [Pseudomonadota bacterium]